MVAQYRDCVQSRDCAISCLHNNTFSSLTISSDPILMLRSPHSGNSIIFPRSEGLSCNCFAGLAAIVLKSLRTKPLKSLPLLIDRQHPQCCWSQLWHLGSRRLPITGSQTDELSTACLGSKHRGLCNLEIVQTYCANSRLSEQSRDWFAISRFYECAAQSRDCTNS